MTSSSSVPCVQIQSSVLRFQSWHCSFILCAVRVKAIFSSLLSLICSRIKGYGWGGGGKQQCIGPGVAVSGQASSCVSCSPCVCPVRGGGPRKGSRQDRAMVKQRACKFEGKQALSEDGWWRGRGRAGLWIHRLGQAKLLKRSRRTFLVQAVLSPLKVGSLLCEPLFSPQGSSRRENPK